jgi:uncharacterized protein YdcH (DUF465 family)
MSLEYRRVIEEYNQLQERNRQVEVDISHQHAAIDNLLKEVAHLKDTISVLGS